MLMKYFCKVSSLVHIQFFFSLYICILFRVKIQWLPEQHLKPVGINDALKIINDGDEASTKESQTQFHFILVSSEAEPRMRLE